MIWQTEEALLTLAIELCACKSINSTDGEKEIIEFIHKKLAALPYFHKNEDYMHVFLTEDKRIGCSVYIPGRTSETIVFSGHVDVVPVEDFGEHASMAFQPIEWTEKVKQLRLTEYVKKDSESNDYLFGRGTMDMLSSIAMCMQLIEFAAEEGLHHSLVMLFVPDEEGVSQGMRQGVKELSRVQDTFNLSYKLFWNTEPTFPQAPTDNAHRIYSGSAGKLLAGVMSVGVEAHVADQNASVNAALMQSFVTKNLELNEAFSETVEGEKTAPPSTLFQRDHKSEYSVQTPATSSGLYNILTMERTPLQITTALRELLNACAKEVGEFYHDRFSFQVYTVQELYEHAYTKFGDEFLERISSVQVDPTDMLHSTSSYLLTLIEFAKDLAPFYVLYYCPPFYPAVKSREDALLNTVREKLASKLRKANERVITQSYFPGLSDMSYIGLQIEESELRVLKDNTPLWDNGYSLPFSEMKKIEMPVLNYGTFGRDAHQWTERVHIDRSYRIAPTIIKEVLKEF
ncbi:M20/M25/M40 family metallo-hydrolase [Paenalkalicoccus suaedae]|uniref:M20/M25/M40 family metallo-hydrolase n=1 Tax=Paenalkalicoccus suaedae TaxID=2592382 RepID=A0A859FDT0_9BACI|nr:M20/M25/M40 family metallo-hydrolase [Paenalkalicoccus suaedae]QKS70998.1 M20/M25/M40 family metallo-hydrolase [Paenalkalicoccus suaedae]